MASNVDNITNINELGLDPNALDEFPSYTYNFTLKLYEAAVAGQVGLPKPGNKNVILAQSGVTAAFNIKKVEILSVPGTTRENRGTIATVIKIDLEEPLGFTFIDRLIQAAASLHLPTLSPAPYVLELSFLGWDENGQPVKPILPTKVWLLNLRDVTPELRKGGTSYVLDFVPSDEQVQQDSRSLIGKPIIFDKAKTLVETLNNFATELSKMMSPASEQVNNTVAGSKNRTDLQQHEYKIVPQNGDLQIDQIANWTMMSNITSNAQRQFEVTNVNGDANKFQITLPEGYDIFDAIRGILANTNEAIYFLAPPATSTDLIFNTSEPTNFFHFDTVTTNGHFDKDLAAWSQLHTITIVPKVVPRNNILPAKPGDVADVQKLIADNILIKGYEYLFTGKNTSVLDVNLNFSTMWFDSMPLFNSLLKDGQLSANIAPNTMPIDNLLPYIPAINKSKVMQTSNQPPSFVLTANDVDATATKTYLEEFSSNAMTVEMFARQEPSRDNAQLEKIMKGFGSPGDPASIAKLSIFGFLADNALINLHKGKGFVSGMTEINLVIRGDPFWLGISPEEVVSNYKNASYASIRKTQRQYACFQSAEQQFYLKFKPPQMIDDNSGLMQFNKSSVFNTLYSAMQVVSIFENGIFKQEIHAFMNRAYKAEAVQATVDPMLDASDLYNQNLTGTTTENLNNPITY